MEQATGPFLTAGSRKLTDSDITFSDEIMETDGGLNFYMDTFFNVDEVFGTHVETVENNDWINVYANYDIGPGAGMRYAGHRPESRSPARTGLPAGRSGKRNLLKNAGLLHTSGRAELEDYGLRLQEEAGR